MKDQIEKAKSLLERMNKNQIDVMTMDMPFVTASTEEERLRAKEGNESITPSEAHNIRVISLGRRLMSIDCKLYGVSQPVANKLVEYIERNEDTVLDELKGEYSAKVKDFYKNLRATNKITRDQYATDEDYQRVRSYLNREIKDYENKLKYLFKLIEVLENYEGDGDITEMRDKKKFQEDFDFSYLDTFWQKGNPMNYSTGLNG